MWAKHAQWWCLLYMLFKDKRFGYAKKIMRNFLGLKKADLQDGI